MENKFDNLIKLTNGKEKYLSFFPSIIRQEKEQEEQQRQQGQQEDQEEQEEQEEQELLEISKNSCVKKKRDYTTILVEKTTREKLKILKNYKGMVSLDSLLNCLIKEAGYKVKLDYPTTYCN